MKLCVEVSTVIKTRAGRPRNFVSNPNKIKITTPLQSIRTGSVAHPSFY
jgi:hypothetical protein